MTSMRKTFTFCAIVIGFFAAPVFAKEQPNIILIMADDVSRDWISCYGAQHETPHIDRLASQGLRFDTAWSMPICTPTRVTLLTGQYPFHHGWTKHYDVPRWGGDGRAPVATNLSKSQKRKKTIAQPPRNMRCARVFVANAAYSRFGTSATT